MKKLTPDWYGLLMIIRKHAIHLKIIVVCISKIWVVETKVLCTGFRRRSHVSIDLKNTCFPHTYSSTHHIASTFILYTAITFTSIKSYLPVYQSKEKEHTAIPLDWWLLYFWNIIFSALSSFLKVWVFASVSTHHTLFQLRISPSLKLLLYNTRPFKQHSHQYHIWTYWISYRRLLYHGP